MNYLDLASDHIAEMYPLIVYGKPRVMELPPGAILGTWAYSVPGKVRFMLAKDMELAPGVLPGDLARAWIRDQYRLPLRRTKEQQIRNYAAPVYARLGEFGNCCYVDIKHAYLDVLRLGYDLEYRPGRYIGAEPNPIPPEIAANKLTYAVTVAMSASAVSNLEVMGKEGVFNHRPMNIYSNPCLFNLAQDILNAIGSEMIALLPQTCVYANTDGFIVRECHLQSALGIIGSWGFDASVKHSGQTEIRGVASYRIGDHKTRRFDRNARDFCSPLMSRDERRWLKGHWTHWIDKLKRG